MKDNQHSKQPEKSRTTTELLISTLGTGAITYACIRSYSNEARDIAKENIPQKWQLDKGIVGDFFKTQLQRYTPNLFKLYSACPSRLKHTLALSVTALAMYEHGKHIQHLTHDLNSKFKELDHRAKLALPSEENLRDSAFDSNDLFVGSSYPKMDK